MYELSTPPKVTTKSILAEFRTPIHILSKFFDSVMNYLFRYSSQSLHIPTFLPILLANLPSLPFRGARKRTLQLSLQSSNLWLASFHRLATLWNKLYVFTTSLFLAYCSIFHNSSFFFSIFIFYIFIFHVLQIQHPKFRINVQKNRLEKLFNF